MMTKSRISLATMILLYGIICVRERSVRGVFYLVASIFSIVNVYSINRYFFNDIRIFNLIDLIDSHSYSTRASLFKYGRSLIEQNLWWGYGTNTERSLLISQAHTYFESASILILVENGLLVYLFYLFVIIQFIRSKNEVIIYIGYAMIFYDLFETVFVYKQLLTFIGLIYGLSSANKEKWDMLV